VTVSDAGGGAQLDDLAAGMAGTAARISITDASYSAQTAPRRLLRR
jgi:hypothetical protein